jgi:hypothetical protein
MRTIHACSVTDFRGSIIGLLACRVHKRVTGVQKACKRVTGMQRTMKYFWRILRIGLNYFGAISKYT